MLVNYMGEAQVDGSSRALLYVGKCINGNNSNSDERREEEDDEEVDLSLGLSLNGRFGVDPNEDRGGKLSRSSSVSTLFVVGGSPIVPTPAAAYVPLSRTCSLPAEAEAGDWRKRKELQYLRRVEAKRRMDKAKFARVGRDFSSRENGSNGDSNDPGLISSTNGSGSGRGSVSGCGNGNEMPSSQGSIGSQGSGSSGISELDSQSNQVDRNNEARSSPSSSAQSAPKQNEQKAQVIPGSKVAKATDKGATESKEGVLKNAMPEMPCVSTTGNGPNGRKVDGFLYRYGKGEEVKIVCVCHGSFLTPAEFVKHAGGADVENPLRHIVVNPAPLL